MKILTQAYSFTAYLETMVAFNGFLVAKYVRYEVYFFIQQMKVTWNVQLWTSKY